LFFDEAVVVKVGDCLGSTRSLLGRVGAVVRKDDGDGDEVLLLLLLTVLPMVVILLGDSIEIGNNGGGM
jgi:hypothetical protein